jgi:tetratricopeptide (TPR) repeat protein
LKGGRDADPRQQTLRATIEWSYDLLSPAEQQLFTRLSVFGGGCTLDAAEQVADAELDTLQSLVEKSLLRFSDGRYWMLETIRGYAAEQLNGVVGDALRERLARQLVRVAKNEGSPLFLGRQADARARLEAEHPNVREVVLWALGADRPELFLALCAELWAVWIERGHALEANAWVERALDELMTGADPAALGGAGKVARFAGDGSRATMLMTRLLEVVASGTEAEPYWETATLAELADLAVDGGDLARARAYAERSLELCRQRHRPAARALASLGDIALREGDLQGAEEALQEAASGFRAFGNETLYASMLTLLSEVARRRGDGTRARNLLADAMTRFAALGDSRALGECLLDLALLVTDEGELEHAARLLGAGQALLERTHSSPSRDRTIPPLPREAQAEGAAMSLEQAVEYGLASIH